MSDKSKEDVLYKKKLKRDIRKGILPRYHFSKDRKKLICTISALTKK